MIQITKRFTTETGHRLTDYKGKCAHLHGHTYHWEITVSSVLLDPTGFIIDYGVLKRLVKPILDDLDHAFLFNVDDPLLKLFDELPGSYLFTELLCSTNGDPGRVHVLPFNPTTENILKWVLPRIQDVLPEDVNLVKIRLEETPSSFAELLIQENTSE